MRIGRDRKDHVFHDFSYQFALCISLKNMKLFSSELINVEKVVIVDLNKSSLYLFHLLLFASTSCTCSNHYIRTYVNIVGQPLFWINLVVSYPIRACSVLHQSIWIEGD
jgi:tellurite resistance protein TehA-like permease